MRSLGTASPIRSGAASLRGQCFEKLLVLVLSHRYTRKESHPDSTMETRQTPENLP
jgi:hypothetical protein